MITTMIALGNPGPQYEQTRHNYGWLVADEIIAKCKLGRTANTPAFEIYSGSYRRTNLVVCKPQTYMNRSGIAVTELMRKMRIDLEEILVLYDDIDISFGKIKLRVGGGDGGHKGIRSIIAETGRRDFSRLRLGIQPSEPPDDTPDFVLSPFDDQEITVLEKAIPAAAQAAIDCLFSDIKIVMNSVNRFDFSPTPPADEEK